MSKNSTPVIRELLDAGAKGGDQVLMSAVRAGDAELTRVVLEKAKPAEEMLTAALVHVPNKKPEIKELLTEAGAKPHPRRTPRSFNHSPESTRPNRARPGKWPSSRDSRS